MSAIKITKKKDSLELATKILEKFFLDNENYSDNSSEFEKWRKWFILKSSQFKSGEISNTLYFSQIVRIRSFLISNTSINNENLFGIEKVMRRKSYDLAQLVKTIPEPFSRQEITDLTRTLFNYLTTDEIRQLKSNPCVESLTKKMRDKRFGFSLNPDPNKNIRYIEDSNMYSDDINREKYLLGELYTESCQLKAEEDSYLQISNEKTQKAGLLNIAIQKRDFGSFQSLLLQAYPESFKPETYADMCSHI